VLSRVSVHFARMLMAESTSPERIIEMGRTEGARAIANSRAAART
jgi:maleate cis-trans isomerase